MEQRCQLHCFQRGAGKAAGQQGRQQSGEHVAAAALGQGRRAAQVDGGMNPVGHERAAALEQHCAATLLPQGMKALQRRVRHLTGGTAKQPCGFPGMGRDNGAFRQGEKLTAAGQQVQCVRVPHHGAGCCAEGLQRGQGVLRRAKAAAYRGGVRSVKQPCGGCRARIRHAYSPRAQHLHHGENLCPAQHRGQSCAGLDCR